MSLKLVCTAVLGLAVTASGRDPAELFLQHGIKLLDRGHFANSVAMLTHALGQESQRYKSVLLSGPGQRDGGPEGGHCRLAQVC